MFDNSLRVPRLYKLASKVAKEVSEGRGSIKQLVYQCKHPNIKALYALVVHTFQKTDEIENLFKKSKLLIKEPKLDLWLAKVLVTELLWGKKRLPDKSKPIKTVLAYEQILKAHFSDISDDFEEIVRVEKPRYVRVNILKTSVNEVVEEFRNEGWILKRHTEPANYIAFLEDLTNLGPEEFMIDIHIPYLLIFPPKTQFYQHHAYKNGTIILQDKASCLPVHILNPEPGSTVLDMCAAPGMKTTQCAALMENAGKIYAVEIGKKRYETLKKIIESSGATCVETINADVLTLSGKDYPDVEYILVDPSCSGSGITDRVEIGQQKQDQNKNRLEKLAGFQIKTLRYALTRFPNVKRVAYSTCSVYPEENEDVVRQVLETCMNFKLVSANQYVENKWTNFGSAEFGDIGNYCLYARPDIDLTSGFFVAVFERLREGERNPFLNEMLFAQRVQGRRRKELEGDGSEVFTNRKKNMNSESGEKLKESNEETKLEIISGKKKRKQEKELDSVPETNTFSEEASESTHKKKKNKNMNSESGEKLKESVKETELENISEKKKRKQEKELDGVSETNAFSEEASESTHKKKKKKKKKENVLNDFSTENVDNNVHESKEVTVSEDMLHKKKKKKKTKVDDSLIEHDKEIFEFEKSDNVVEDTFKKKRNKKKKRTDDSLDDKVVNTKVNVNEDGTHKKKKKKKVQKDEVGNSENGYSLEVPEDEILLEQPKKKKKKKEKILSEFEQNVECTLLESINSSKSEDTTNIDSDTKLKKKKKKIN